MLVIDGSYGEGGGQVLRSAVSLAAVLGRPLRVESIRSGRSKPGLRPQHLTAVRAAAAVCQAELEGDALGSLTLTFVPAGPPRAATYEFDVAEESGRRSAGSVGLVLQAVLPPLARSGGESALTLRGGTHVPWAPTASYLDHVFLPLLDRIGVKAELDARRWGFYPAGGGEVQVRIVGPHGPLRPLTLVERGPLRRVYGTAAAMNLPAHVVQRMATRAANLLAEAGIDAEVKPRRMHGAGPGAGLFLVAEYERVSAGFSGHGRRGLPAEQVAEAACKELLEFHGSGAPVDEHLADQLLLPLALAEGESKFETSQVSQHLVTNAWVVGQFIGPAVTIEGEVGAPGNVVVQGVGCD